MNNSHGGGSFPAESYMPRILAIGWVTGLALLYLIRYEAWLSPVRCVYVLWSALPTLRPGPYLGEFVRDRLADFGCITAIVATAFAVGATATGRWLPRRDRLGALVALAFGLWITAVVVLALGAISISLVRWVYAGAACWLLPAPRRFFHRGPDAPQALEQLDGWTRFLLVCLVMAVVLNLFGAMMPPFEYDELEYHLGAPAEYFRAGRILLLPHNFYSNMPQLTEMLYLLAVATSSDIAAKLLHWSFGVLSALVVYVVAVRLWSRRVAVAAAALFYCALFVQDLSRTARIELATTFFAALAFGTFVLWTDTGTGRGKNAAPTDTGWLWLSALMAGGAVATKWTAIAVVLLPVLVFAAVLTRSPRRLSVLCLLSSVFVIPWLVKNWVLAGNPVYPLLTNVWPSPHWSAAQAALFAEKHYPSFDAAGWLQLGERLWQYSFLDMGAVPLLLMAMPLVLLVRKVDAATRRTGWLFVLAYAGWFLCTFRPWRFLFPALPLAAMVAGWALYAFDGERWVRWAMRGAVGLVMGIGLSAIALGILVDAEELERVPPQMSPVQYALGHVGRDEFTARMGHGLFEPIMWMNRNLPANARVLYIGEARVALARHAVVWATAFDQHPLSAMSREAATETQLYSLLRQRGVTYVYINGSELARLGKNYGYLRDVNWPMFDEMLKEHAQLIHGSGHSAVYELK